MNQSGLPTPPPQSGPSSSSAPTQNQPQTHQSDMSLSIDVLVQQIVSSNNIASLNQTLKNCGPKDVRDTILAAPLASGQDPLGLLDVRVNTLGVLYILSARLHAAMAPPPPLSVIDDFCRSFIPEQARFAPDRVTLLAKGIVRLAENTSNPKYAIQPLYDLLTRYPPSLSFLTTIHPIFLSACVSTQHFTSALSVLATPVTVIDTSLSDLHYNDNLVYHYAGGMALAALKHWNAAEEFFEICVSSPGQAPAAVQMEALKKLVLVQLISKGKTTPPPKYTNSLLLRLLKNTPYATFVNHYPQQTQKLRELVDKEEQLFTTEKTLGLVTQALERAPRWSIKKLTSTYLTLSLFEIGKAVQLEDEDEVRALVISMIESSEISAQISASGIVTFSDPPPQFTKADVDRVLQEAHSQGGLLEKLEKDMARSREYLVKALRNKEDTWGPPAEEDVVGMFGGPSISGAFAEDATFS